MRKIIVAATTAGVSSLNAVTATAVTIEATILSAQEASQLMHAHAKSWRELGEEQLETKKLLARARRKIEEIDELTDLFSDLGNKLEADPMKKAVFDQLTKELIAAGYESLAEAIKKNPQLVQNAA